MGILAVEYAVPATMQTAEDIGDATGASVPFIRQKVGIDVRYVLSPDETGTDLSEAACLKLFEAHDLVPEQIELLVVVTQTPDHQKPQNSALLADRLNLQKSVASFDLSLGCSGYVYGVFIVEAFLKLSGMSNAVLVTCDPYSRTIDPSDKATNSVFGDAATATWIKRDSGGQITSTDFGTIGGKGSAIRVDAGAAIPAWSILGGWQAPDAETQKLKMDGRGVFNFVNTEIPGSIERCLNNANRDLTDIDWFAIHQGSVYMLNAMAQRTRIPKEKLLVNMERFGNTVSSSIPLLLNELQSSDRLRGNTILASGFGVGLSWATAIIEF